MLPDRMSVACQELRLCRNPAEAIDPIGWFLTCPTQSSVRDVIICPFLKISCQEGLDEDVNLLTYLHEAPEQTDLQLQKDLQRHSTGT